MSRELSSGSIKFLYSSPITTRQIILGKYLSMMIYGAMLMAILLIYIIFGAFTIENMDLPLALTGLLGLYLLTCAMQLLDFSCPASLPIRLLPLWEP